MAFPAAKITTNPNELPFTVLRSGPGGVLGFFMKGSAYSNDSNLQCRLSPALTTEQIDGIRTAIEEDRGGTNQQYEMNQHWLYIQSIVKVAGGFRLYEVSNGYRSKQLGMLLRPVDYPDSYQVQWFQDVPHGEEVEIYVSEDGPTNPPTQLQALVEFVGVAYVGDSDLYPGFGWTYNEIPAPTQDGVYASIDDISSSDMPNKPTVPWPSQMMDEGDFFTAVYVGGFDVFRKGDPLTGVVYSAPAGCPLIMTGYLGPS